MTTEDKLVQLFNTGNYQLMYQLMLATDTRIDSDKIKLYDLIVEVTGGMVWPQQLDIQLLNTQWIGITRNYTDLTFNIHINADSSKDVNIYFESQYQLSELFGNIYRSSKLDFNIKALNLTEAQVIEYIFHFLYLPDDE